MRIGPTGAEKPVVVGMGFNPPVYLQPGDVVELGIDKLGTQRQRVLAPR